MERRGVAMVPLEPSACLELALKKKSWIGWGITVSRSGMDERHLISAIKPKLKQLGNAIVATPGRSETICVTGNSLK